MGSASELAAEVSLVTCRRGRAEEGGREGAGICSVTVALGFRDFWGSFVGVVRASSRRSPCILKQRAVSIQCPSFR